LLLLNDLLFLAPMNFLLFIIIMIFLIIDLTQENNLLLIFFIDNLNICLVVLKYTLTSQSGDTNTDPTWYHFLHLI
jgi:hypothetical protein